MKIRITQTIEVVVGEHFEVATQRVTCHELDVKNLCDVYQQQAGRFMGQFEGETTEATQRNGE